MAQAIQALPAANGQALPIGTPALIAGLLITILNGAGWIKASFSAVLQNTYAGVNVLELYLHVDGVQQPLSRIHIYIPETYYTSIARSVLIKPGAGQHTYEIFAAVANDGTLINELNANLLIEEPGF
jgi:hypothetical protein